VLERESEISEEFYLVPHALVELSECKIILQKESEAKDLLIKAKGYHVRIKKNK
jgi:hypothetical protein